MVPGPLGSQPAAAHEYVHSQKPTLQEIESGTSPGAPSQHVSPQTTPEAQSLLPPPELPLEVFPPPLEFPPLLVPPPDPPPQMESQMLSGCSLHSTVISVFSSPVGQPALTQL